MAKPKANPTRITRAGNGHSYYLDGARVPGVTTVLGKGIPKPALVGWAATTVANYVIDRLELERDGDDVRIRADALIDELRRLNATSKYPQRLDPTGLPRTGLAKVLGAVHYADRDQAANRGTEVHRLAEQMARGAEVDVPDELAGHVAAYVAFLDEVRPANAILERVVVNRRWSYMGKLDMIAELELPPSEALPDGFDGLALIDVKTSRSGIFGEVALQLAGYRYAETLLGEDGLTEEPMPEVAGCFAVHVRADGYDLIPVDVTPDDFRVFLYAKQVGDWLETRARDVIGPRVRP